MALYSHYILPGTIKQGYLIKSPPMEKSRLKGWKKRWCVFSRANSAEPCLNYYRTEEDSFSSLPIKRVNLKRCSKVEMDLTHSSHKNIFAVHLPERIYYFSAPSQIEMSEWADALCTHLELMTATSDSMLKKLRSNTMPTDGVYSVSPSNYGALTIPRPLPPIPNSVNQPPSPSRSPGPPLPPSPHPRTSSPLPPPPHSASPLPPLPSSSSPLPPPPPSPRQPGPSMRPYSPHPPVVPEHYMTPNHSSPSRTSPLPPRRQVSPPPPVPSHYASPPHRPLMEPPPPRLPLRSHSPSADLAPRLPNSARGGIGDDIASRPPAPPPKQLEEPGEQESYELEEAPPTPPPRPQDKTFSPEKTFSPSESTSSNSEDDSFDAPPIPPRPD